MSDPVTILGTIAVGFAVDYITEKLTGSETLGMIAGLAAGGWAGSAISSYQAAQAAGTAATSAAQAGSALKVAGGAPLGTQAIGAVGGAVPAASPITAQGATAAPGAVLPGAGAVAPAAVKTAAPAATASSSFLGFSPDELLKVAAGGISGMAEYKQREKDREIDKELVRLRRDEFEEDKRRYKAQGAYGVTNEGQVVPINAGQQLQAMNQRLGYKPFTSMGTMTNISTVQRPDGGYVSQFGRFSGGNQNA